MQTLDRSILQHVARRAATNRRDLDWCRWGTPEDASWEFHDYRPLVAAGLLEKRETWKDVLLRLTDEGWKVLSAE